MSREPLFVQGLRGVFISLVLVAMVSSLSGQFSSAIEGTVTDPSGAGIPDAQVELTNTGIGVIQRTSTNASGYFRVPSLPTGAYQARVSKEGFETLTQNLQLGGAEVRTLSLSMRVGNLQTEVTVVGEPPAVQTAESKISNAVTAPEVRDLPIQGRNILGLVALTPGVTGTGNAAARTDNFDIFSLVGEPRANANGSRSDGNGLYVDNTSATSNPDPGVFNIIPNPESVQELNVSVNDYSAEYGRGNSILIQAVTKSGTNELHGSLFEYHQDNKLTARNVFQNSPNPLTGRVLPVTRRNEFGGSIGGPIQKNKTFAFLSWDQVNSSVSTTTRLDVETPQLLAFMKSRFPNNLSTLLVGSFPVEASAFEAGSIQTVADLSSQCATSSVGPNGMPCDLPVRGASVTSISTPRKGLQWNIRVDRYFNDSKDRLYFGFFRRTLTEAGTNPRPTFRVNFTPISNYANLNWTHTFSPTILNEAAVGFTRPQGNSNCNECRVPVINVTGLQGFGNGFAPAMFIQNDYHWRDILTVNRGNHALKMGFDIFRDQENDPFSGPQQRPTFNFVNIFDFVADKPQTQTGINYDPRNGDVAFQDIQYRTTTYGFFAQDAWKVRPGLSVNLGVRWDFSSNPYEKNGRLSNIILGNGSTFVEKIANASVKPVERLLETHRRAYFAPRFNIAWDPTGRGKMSIRAGFGVFMNRWPNKTWSDATRFNPPWQSSITADVRIPSGPQPIFQLCQSNDRPWNCPVPGGLLIGLNERGGPLTGRASIGGTAPDFQYAYSVNRFVGVQYQFSPDWIFEADYLGSRGNHLYTVINRNRFAGDVTSDGVLDRLNPFFTNINYADNSAWSNYNGGTLSVRKRPSQGLGFQVNYNFGSTTSVSDAIGPGFASANSLVYYAYDLNGQKGPASFDIAHNVTFNVIWELPKLESAKPVVKAVLGGWQTSTISVLQTGLPATVFTNGADWNGDGTNSDLPNTPSFGRSLSGLTRSDYLAGVFRASDFPIPAPGTQGDLGRNTYRGPGYANVNFSLMKNFGLPWFGPEEARLQLRGEFYNLFNRVNLNAQGWTTNLSSGTFGRATTAFYPRTIQLGLRLDF